MGAGRTGPAVADAGPLIHLNEIGRLSLLRAFSVVHIPDAVWAEAVESQRVVPVDVERATSIQRHSLDAETVSRFVHEQGLEALHHGERECLHLCRQLNVPLLLTDDLAVRDVAKRIGITPVGSLGVVVRAYYLGEISIGDAELSLASLYDVSSLFVTRAIVDAAVQQLRDHAHKDPSPEP